jgi:hypothetical protein
MQKLTIKTYLLLSIVVGVSAMRAGGQTSVCGLSFGRSRDGTARISLKKINET